MSVNTFNRVHFFYSLLQRKHNEPNSENQSISFISCNKSYIITLNERRQRNTIPLHKQGIVLLLGWIGEPIKFLLLRINLLDPPIFIRVKGLEIWKGSCISMKKKKKGKGSCFTKSLQTNVNKSGWLSCPEANQISKDASNQIDHLIANLFWPTEVYRKSVACLG